MRKRKSGFGGFIWVLALLAIFTGRYVFLLPFAVVYLVPLLIVLFVLFLVVKLIRTAKLAYHEAVGQMDRPDTEPYTPPHAYRSGDAPRYTYAETPEYTVEAVREEAGTAPNIANAAGVAEMRKSVASFRQLMDATANAGLKRDIETVCAFSDRLVSVAETDKSKRASVRKFLNYYLPVLYKLVTKHAEIEAMDLTSAQSAEIRAKITGAVSKTAEAFEVKLNLLYENEILDIDSEICVLETMLAKDGLTVNRDFEAVLSRNGAGKDAAPQGDTRRSMALILDEVNASVDQIDMLIANVK